MRPALLPAWCIAAAAWAAPLPVPAGHVTDEAGVLDFVAGAGAVFAVEGDIEQGAKFLLQGNRFAHQLFAAGVMVTSWQQKGLAIALE